MPVNVIRYVSLLLFVITSSSPTEWELLAHGSTRTPYDSSSNTKSFIVTSPMEGNLIQWQTPFGFTPTQYGGIDQSLQTGHLHIQVTGTDNVNIGPEEPGGGSLKQHGPPYIWEVDINTGNTVRVYNLSDYGKTFYSIVRYTPAGNPVVAVCNSNSVSGINILVLDTESDQVLWEHKPSIEPMLLQITNTDPQQLLYASMYSDGAMNFNESGIVPHGPEIVNNDISTIIFHADGKGIFNNGFSNEAAGIYTLDLPLVANNNEKSVVPGCTTYPWVMASDTNGNIYAECAGSVNAFTATGSKIWSMNSYAAWVILDDTESIVIVGNTNYYMGLDAKTGSILFNTTRDDIKTRNDGNKFGCYQSNQPWAPRHPIPTSDGRLCILCVNDGIYDVRFIDLKSGKLVGKPVEFDQLSVVNMLVADDNSFYGIGYNDKKISVQRVLS